VSSAARHSDALTRCMHHETSSRAIHPVINQSCSSSKLVKCKLSLLVAD
jgi:hypothetical protein